MKMSLAKAVAAALVAGTALTGGAVHAATIGNVGSSGASDLVLFVSDTSNNTYFTLDLGQSLDSVFQISQVSSDKTAGNDYNVGTLLGSFTISSSSANALSGNSVTLPSLKAYLDSTGTTDIIKYSILATNQTLPTNNAGAKMFLTTSAGTNLFDNEPTTANAATMAGNTTTFFGAINTANIGSTGVSTSIGWGKGAGASAPNSFVSLDFANGADLGTAQNFYAVATYGAGTDANVYASTNTVTLNRDGTLTISGSGSASVPVPAAVWLFGSGLLGLTGIGRRRKTAIAA